MKGLKRIVEAPGFDEDTLRNFKMLSLSNLGSSQSLIFGLEYILSKATVSCVKNPEIAKLKPPAQ